MNTLNYYQHRVPGLHQEGSDYRARCPMHGGATDNSLSVDPKAGTWFCHGACGEGGDAIKLEQRLFNIPFLAAKKAVDEVLGVIPDEPIQIATKRKPMAPIEALYDYTDADGTLLYQVVRLQGKDFRQRRPDPEKPGKWLWSLGKDLAPTLYRLPEVLMTSGTAYIAEGEKDVDALRDQLGLTATCNSGGAGKFTAGMAKVLAGRNIVILPDQDKAGAKHARDTATLLVLAGCRVKVVDLPAKDPADWLAAGGDLDQLGAIQRATPEWAPHAVAAAPSDEMPDRVPTGIPANLHEMLQTYVILVGSSEVWDRRRNCIVSPDALKLAHGDDYKAWAKDDDRLRIDREQLVFKPEGAAKGEINLFGGLPDLTVIGRNVDAWLDHVRLLAGRDEELTRWVITRLAYKLQHLGEKVMTSIVIHGAQGTGKNLLFARLLDVYGRYGAEIGQQQIESPYTGWLSGKLLIVADEVAGRATRYHVKNKLKALITAEEIAIEEKFVSVRWERNLADLHFLSNEEIPVIIEPGDRRFAILRCDEVQGADYYARLAAVDPGALREVLMAWDCSAFTAHAKPPETTAKAELLELTQEPTDRFLDAWLSGDTPLPVVGAATADLYLAYKAWSTSSGERLVTQSASHFGRYVRKRLLPYSVKAFGKTYRTWAIGTQQPTPEELEQFHKAAEAWTVKEQTLRL